MPMIPLQDPSLFALSFVAAAQVQLQSFKAVFKGHQIQCPRVMSSERDRHAQCLVIAATEQGGVHSPDAHQPQCPIAPLHPHSAATAACTAAMNSCRPSGGCRVRARLAVTWSWVMCPTRVDSSHDVLRAICRGGAFGAWASEGQGCVSLPAAALTAGGCRPKFALLYTALLGRTLYLQQLGRRAGELSQLGRCIQRPPQPPAALQQLALHQRTAAEHADPQLQRRNRSRAQGLGLACQKKLSHSWPSTAIPSAPYSHGCKCPVASRKHAALPSIDLRQQHLLSCLQQRGALAAARRPLLPRLRPRLRYGGVGGKLDVPAQSREGRVR